jgi:hypothetical protein
VKNKQPKASKRKKDKDVKVNPQQANVGRRDAYPSEGSDLPEN